MNIDQAELDQWACYALRASEAVAVATFAAREGDTLRAQEQLRGANDDLQRLHAGLQSAGASPPDGAGAPADVPLALLDTPATRRLLAALRAAVGAAEAVDAERGHVLPGFIPLLRGETRGTGWAETLSELAERLRVEVEGPTGCGEG